MVRQTVFEGSFEDGLDPWVKILGSEIGLQTNPGFGDPAGTFYFCDTMTSGGGVKQTGISCHAGKLMVGSCRINAGYGTVSGSIYLTFLFYDAFGVEVLPQAYTAVAISNGMPWTDLYNSGTVPAGACKVDVLVQAGTISGTGYWYVDNVRLTEQLSTGPGVEPDGKGGTRVITGGITEALLADLAVSSAKIADGAVLTSKIPDYGIITSKLAPYAVDSNKIADLAVQAIHLANSAVTSTKIANLAVGTAAIGLLAVGNAQIANAAITNVKIANLAVGTAQIADAAITNVKIGQAQIQTIHIVDASVTQAKIGNLAVGTAQIADAAITNAKIANLDVGKLLAGTMTVSSTQSGVFVKYASNGFQTSVMPSQMLEYYPDGTHIGVNLSCGPTYSLLRLTGSEPVPNDITLSTMAPSISINGNPVLSTRVATTPVTLADVIAVLQHHGLCN